MIPRYVVAVAVTMLSLACLPGWADDPAGRAGADRFAAVFQPASPGEDAAASLEQSIRAFLTSYLEAFNRHDSAALGNLWTEDGESFDQETGERTSGRTALVEAFAELFRVHPEVRLIGQLDRVRQIRPDVVTVDGRTTLVDSDEPPVESTFSAILVRDGEGWQVSSSNERDLPVPATSHDALRELEWLVGTWQDQSESADVTTTVRWSPSQAFLIRSFSAQFADGESTEGTQIIGWDPLHRQIRTWTFNSDGSFAEGTAARHGDDWSVKLTQVLSDGRVAAGTQVFTRVDEDTIEVQTIGQTIDGEPSPASAPITVVRTLEEDANSTTAPPASEGANP
jgi:uncharacterized protein (TIGR02246 family)